MGGRKGHGCEWGALPSQQTSVRFIFAFLWDGDLPHSSGDAVVLYKRAGGAHSLLSQKKNSLEPCGSFLPPWVRVNIGGWEQPCCVFGLKRDLEEDVKGIFSPFHVLCHGVVFNQLKSTYLCRLQDGC